jgi:hypothetical protein
MYGEHSKRATVKKLRNDVLFQRNEIIVIKEPNGEHTFQIGKIYTSDVLEAVAILMRNSRWAELDIWDIEVEIEEVNSINCIYWLSGGEEFWNHPSCNVEWVDIYPTLIERFEGKLESVKKRKTLRDIRKYFKKHFNLDTFYDFALSKNII